jgi:hypothetical protein
MSAVSINPGERGRVLDPASRPAGTYNSDDYWLIRGGGLLIYLEVTAVGAAPGVVTTISLQAKNGENYDTVAQFGALAINAVGRYTFRVAQGASRVAGANAYKGAIEEAPPTAARIQIVHTTDAMNYSVKVESVM